MQKNKTRDYIYIICRDRETNKPTGTVIAISSYAGRPVRGIAKCNPGDEFDVEFGMKLAAARCNLKIAQKRYRRAGSKYQEAANASIKAANASIEAKKQLDKMRTYYCDATDGYDAAAEELKNVLANL
jgi:hypothetical protein